MVNHKCHSEYILYIIISVVNISVFFILKQSISIKHNNLSKLIYNTRFKNKIWIICLIF